MSKYSKDALRGISQLVNKQNVKKGINYEEIEKNLTNNGLIVENKDPTEMFNMHLKELAKSLNLPLGTPLQSVKSATASRQSARVPTVSFGGESRSQMNYSRGRDYIGSSIAPRQNISNSALLMTSGFTKSRDDRASESEDSSDENASNHSDEGSVHGSASRRSPHGNSFRPSQNNSSGGRRENYPKDEEHSGGESEEESDDSRDSRNNGHGSAHRTSSPKVRDDFPNFDYSMKPDAPSEFNRRTQEERIHNQVRGVINDLGGDTKIMSLENAKREDDKICMLEEIDSLRQGLEEEGVQGLDKIPKVNENDSYEMVENVLKRLRLKNDRSRYTSLADEFILWGASALEDLFDGRRVWFGKRPDLTGWSKEVQVKLRRMHHDTSTLISGIMHDFNIGPATRVVLELVPNCVMYARRKKINQGKPDLFESEGIASSIDSLRNFD